MREYLMGIQKYLDHDEFRFMVVAEDKVDAMMKAKRTEFYQDDRYIKETLRVVRKLPVSHYGSEPWKRIKEG